MKSDQERFAFIADVVRRAGSATGSCLLAGESRIQVDASTAAAIASRCGLLATKNGKYVFPEGHPLATRSTHDLLKDPSGMLYALGFRNIDRLAEGRDAPGVIDHDLDTPGLEKATQRRYDLIIDAGAMARFFHIPNVLANLCRVLKVHGSIVHFSPMNGFLKGGRYQFSPTFFFDYYAANRFQECRGTVVDCEHSVRPSFFSPYVRTADSLRQNPYLGPLTGAPLEFWFSARKTPESACDVLPTQFLYDPSSLADHPSLRSAHKVVAWGAGLAAATVLAKRLRSDQIAFFVDSDPTKHGGTCLGLPVRSPEALLELNDATVLISAVTHSSAIRLEISKRFSEHVLRVIELADLIADPSGTQLQWE